MLCRIADLYVDVPNVGDMLLRCKPYAVEGVHQAEIVIPEDRLLPDRYPLLSANDNYYLDSGFCFYHRLLGYDGIMLHSSCIVVDGLAYIFSGDCGVGKSTHAQKYLGTFPNAAIINDDKPALRRVDGKWYAYGTPWCGKDGINENKKAPIAGICFLEQGDTKIKSLSPLEALPNLIRQTVGRGNGNEASVLMHNLDLLIREVPICQFTNHAYDGDERITFNFMKDKYEENK